MRLEPRPARPPATGDLLRRLAAYSLDLCVIFGLVLALRTLLSLDFSQPVSVWVWLAIGVLGCGYFAAGSYVGATLGQWAFGLRVVDASSPGTITVGRSILRATVKVALGPFTALTAFAGADARTVHDRASATLVVRHGREVGGRV